MSEPIFRLGKSFVQRVIKVLVMRENHMSSNLYSLVSRSPRQWGDSYIVKEPLGSNIRGGKTTDLFKRVNDHPIIMFLYTSVSGDNIPALPNRVIVSRLQVPLDLPR